jgi:hypothetical protein
MSSRSLPVSEYHFVCFYQYSSNECIYNAISPRYTTVNSSLRNAETPVREKFSGLPKSVIGLNAPKWPSEIVTRPEMHENKYKFKNSRTGNVPIGIPPNPRINRSENEELMKASYRKSQRQGSIPVL